MGPFTILMLGAAAAHGGATLYGAAKQYDAYKQQEAQILETAVRNRDAVLAQGNVAVEQLQYRNRFKKGIEINKVAASGINSTGSAAEVGAQNEYFGELDVYRTRQNSIAAANNYIHNAFNQVGELEDQLAEAPLTTGISLLGIAAGTASQFALNGKYNQLNLNSMTKMSNQEAARQAAINLVNDYRGMNGSPLNQSAITPNIGASNSSNLINNNY